MLNKSIEEMPDPVIKPKRGEATFADNVLTLAGGATLALAITIVAAPITSRLFGPDAFGLAALFRSGAATLGIIACLRYEMAIVLPANDEEAASLFSLSCIALLAMTSLATILTWLFGARVLLYLGAPDLKPYLWLFPLCLFLLGLQLPLNHWYARHKRFKLTAIGRIVGSFSTSTAEIGGGYAGFKTGQNLVVIRFLALIIPSVYLLSRLSSVDFRIFANNISCRKLLVSAKRYIKFPIYDALSMLINQIAVHAPVILLTAFFDAAVCGFFTKALYLLLLPSLIVGQSVGQVFLQASASSKAAGKDLAELVGAVLDRMVTIGMLPFTILFMVGPEFFGTFLGVRWMESGVYAQILVPQLFAVFVAGSISTLFGTLAKQELNLILNGFILTLRVGLLIYGGLVLRDVRLTLFIFMVANVLFSLFRIFLLMRVVKLHVARPLKHFLRCTAYVIPSVAFLAAMKWWAGLQGAYLVALTPICVIPYGLLVLRQDLELRDLVTKTLRKIYAF